MKKIYIWSILTLIIATFLPSALLAQENASSYDAGSAVAQHETHVTPAQALNVGYTFMRTGTGTRGGGTHSSEVREQAMQLVYTGQAYDSLTGTTTDCYYVFSLQPKGFVIVAADDRVEPILGYSYDNDFAVANMPDHVRGWLGNYEKQIEAVAKSDLQAEPATQTKWARLKSGQSMSTKSSGDTTVGPLLTTTWDQGQYYNSLCPEDSSGPAGHVYTGCVATAMAQIINYWGHPVHGRGTHSYGSSYGTLSVNYDSANYDYSLMPNALTATSSAQEVNVVAGLIRDCGVAVNMQYYATESGAQAFDIRGAMTNYFRFSPQIKYSEKNFWPENEWNQIVRDNIIRQHPVLYSGSGNNGGHLFVCDGYDAGDYFHLNFGWSGAADGWYQLSAIEPTTFHDFSSNQTALFDIFPDSTESNVLYAQQSWGQHSTFSVSNPIDLLGVMENNLYPFWGGWMYSGGHTFTFRPSDTTKQLVLYILGDIRIEAIVYDGPTTGDSLLRSFQSQYGHFLNLDLSPVISTNHALTIYLESAAWDYGNHFLIAEYNGCDIVSDINVAVDTTTAHLSWNANSDASQWEIEYGYSGFVHGEGTTLVANTNTIEIQGLSSFKEYDFYIRQICSDSLFGVWGNPATAMMSAPLWTDVVCAIPPGFVEDSIGNVLISTAEGFAWLARVANGIGMPSPNTFQGKTVRLTSDINLGRYLWNPINEFQGIMDGNGHIIDSLFVVSQAGGIIRHLDNATIKNITLVNCHIDNKAYNAAGIALYANESNVSNCYVKGTITSKMGYSAGIVSQNWNTIIINCHVNGYITGQYSTSGISSISNHSIIRNCYSAARLTTLGLFGASISDSNYDSTEVSNCYANYYRSGSWYVAGTTYEGIYLSLTNFIQENEEWVLLDPISFEDVTCTRLIDALNRGVVEQNIAGLRLWTPDTIGINEGMPILGNAEHIVTCPNISNVSLRNVSNGNNSNGIEVSWVDVRDSGLCEIRCFRLLDQILQSVDTVGVFSASTNPDTLWNLIEGETYIIQVRAICDSGEHGAWSERKNIVFDRPYWTDVVTSQPNGYLIDSDGNVIISSTEGLAWLSSVVNGTNGQSGDLMQNKTVRLDCNVNLGQYKWKTIYNFCGSFNGGGHTIDSLIIRENTDNHGFFANTNGASIRNVIFDNAYVKGHNHIGTICGGSNVGLTLNNCRANTTVYAYDYAGAIVACAGNSRIDNCSSEGTVTVDNTGASGLICQISGYDTNTFIRNCYSQCALSAHMLAGGIVGGESYGYSIINCYSSCSINCFFHAGGIVGSSSLADINNCYTTLYVPESPGYLVNDHSPIGIILGANSGSFTAKNVYYPHPHAVPLVSTHEYQEYYCSYIDTMGVDIEDSLHQLNTAIYINGLPQTNLLDALNAWVDTYDTNGVYRHWAVDSTNVNGGFPVFADFIHCTPVAELVEATACDNYSWNDSVYFLSGDYTRTFTAANGCDSTVILHLTINPSVPEFVEATACYSYTWNDQTYTTSGDYTQTFTAANGCDSIVTLHLTINPSVTEFVEASACGSYSWNDQTFTTSGDYIQTFTAANGCDSIVTLHLTINPSVPEFVEATACYSYTWNDSVYTESGDYEQTFTAVNGCDSIVTLHLTVNPSVAEFVEATACGSYEWNGTTYTVSGDYEQTFTAANGCDSVVTLHLTINQPSTGTDVQTACGSYTWIDGITYTESNSTATYTLTNATGCDSIVTLNLTIFPADSTDFAETACDSFEWNGETFTSSGDYTRTLTNASGCDSVVTLHLTIQFATSAQFADTACGSYEWNGQTYTSSGDYTQTLTAANGCDSTVTLHLTITVGIDDHGDFAFNLYPNPTNGLVNVQFTHRNSPITQIQVFDAYGKLVGIVETGLAPSLQTVQIDLSGFAAGMYFIKAVANGNVVAVRKLLKR